LNNTKQALRISVRSKNVFTILKIVHVRWLAKNSGAFVFGCPFLCFFLLGKQKKENKTFPFDCILVGSNL